MSINADWLPEIGDFVERDEEIATIETDKVSGISVQTPPSV